MKLPRRWLPKQPTHSACEPGTASQKLSQKILTFHYYQISSYSNLQTAAKMQTSALNRVTPFTGAQARRLYCVDRNITNELSDFDCDVLERVCHCYRRSCIYCCKVCECMLRTHHRLAF